jgi:hypothetical protein
MVVYKVDDSIDGFLEDQMSDRLRRVAVMTVVNFTQAVVALA